MPKRGNPNIATLGRRGRPEATRESFFFKVDERYRVTRDRYNLLIVEVCTAEATGRKYTMSRGYYTTMKGVCKGISELSNITPQAQSVLTERVKDIETEYVNGKLVIKAPSTIAFDPRDLPEDANTKEDDDDSDTTSEEIDQ